MLADRVAATLERWDAARARAGYRYAGVVVGVLVFGLLVALPTPAGLKPEAQRCGALALVMAGFWVMGVLPMALTALLPIVAFPVLGVLPLADTAAQYMSPLNVLMLGGFVLGFAMEQVGLHRRLTAALLAPAWVRASPRRVLLAVMLACALLSMLMSNTATMAMMLPLGAATAALVAPPGDRARTAYPLGLAYAASIGGVGTLIGTPTNAALAGMADKLVGRPVTFARWLVVGVPFVAVALPLTWLVVSRVAIPLPDRPERPIEAPDPGPWRTGERAVLAVVDVTLFAWIFRAPIDLGAVVLPGWGRLVPAKIDDGWVALVAAFALFLLPGESAEGGRKPLLSWSTFASSTPWSMLLLLGGGFALAEGIDKTELTAWLAGYGARFADLPVPLATLVICGGMVVVTEFVSNTAATQIAVPLLAAAAKEAGVDPFVWMIPATIAASCGFMMPAGTPPNAMAVEAGGVRPADMAWAGFLVNVLCVLVATAVSLLFARFVG